ncbi:AMP-binding protein [Nonomuraea sp. NPDC049269]|uniref:AMP-binding protein n=1 Tax=Nonomuraea sp. NPDC049269 TaxID=3364349 RepID=UPI00371DAA5E
MKEHTRAYTPSIEKRRLVDRIYLHAITRPTQVALECGTRSLTYAALAGKMDERVGTLSGSVGPGRFTVIERRRSIEFVVDFLAVLALDGVPVPLDPDLPARRKETLLGLIRPGVVLRDGAAILGVMSRDGAAMPGLVSRDAAEPSGVVLPDGAAISGLVSRGAAGPSGLGEPGTTAVADGAYVFFTSGSTGRPKPVLGSAAALTSFLAWQCAEFGVEPGDRVAFLTALSFDVAVRDVFLPLWAGATLVIPALREADSPEATVAWLRHSRVSVVNVVPSVARGWLRHCRTRCESMRTVFFAGEPLAASLLEEWQLVFPGTRTRVNLYGTTETTLPKIWKRLPVSERFTGALPAGGPVPQTRFCLIDPAGPFDAALVRAALRNPAAEGEIVLVSPHTGHGYVGMPEETAARFADLGGVTAYRTGDLGRVSDGGELVVLGRADDELKVNGVRIHPAEVAAAIRACGPVNDVHVTAERSAGRARLTAYIVPAKGRALDLLALRRDLTTTLPVAMIPTALVELAELPSLPNGKIDRTALRLLAQPGASPGTPTTEPATRPITAPEPDRRPVTAESPQHQRSAGAQDRRSVGAEGPRAWRSVRTESPQDRRSVETEGPQDRRSVETEGPWDQRPVEAESLPDPRSVTARGSSADSEPAAIRGRSVEVGAHVVPDGDVERWLADRWAELFETSGVSAGDDFFALGGDSISAMQLVSRIRRDLGVTLSVRDIFAAVTVTAIAREIADRRLLAMDADELLAMLETVEQDASDAVMDAPSGVAGRDFSGVVGQNVSGAARQGRCGAVVQDVSDVSEQEVSGMPDRQGSLTDGCERGAA